MNTTVPVLPKEAYLSQQWFEQELELIFSKTWQFAGLMEDVNEHGQYKAVQVGKHPLIIINNNGELLAFHNLCRHRGTPLLEGSGTLTDFMTCPYHHWSYDLNGKLIGAPQRKKEFPNLDLDNICLHKASVEIWRSMLWVHPDANAPSAASWFEHVLPNLGPHQPEKLQQYPEYSTHHEINANWKIIAENFMDVYHLKYLHSHTLYMYDHVKAQFGWNGPHYWFYEPLSNKHEKELPYIDHIPEDKLGAYVPILFPNLGLAESESTWSTFHIIPVAPNKSIVETRSRGMPQGMIGSALSWLYGNEQQDSNNETHPLESGDFMAEDVYVCEQIQKGMNSPKYEVGYTAKEGESTIREYQKIIQDYMSKNR